MKRRIPKRLKLYHRHAPLALLILIEEGKVTARDVAGALKRRAKMIRDLRVRLASLERTFAEEPFRLRRFVVLPDGAG